MTINLTDPQAPVTDEELDQMIWKLERDGGMTPKLLSLMRELREVRKLESGLRIAVGIVPLTDGEMSLLLNAEKLNQPVSNTYKLPSQSSNDVNDAAWKLHDMLTEHGPLNGYQFNNLKECFYEALKVAMRNSPAAPVAPVAPDVWRVEAERLAELHGCSFVVFRHGGEPQCADPTKVIISFTDKGLGYAEDETLRGNVNSSTKHLRENSETSTNCPKCGGHGTYHCPQMLGTVECECALPTAPKKAGNNIREDMKMGGGAGLPDTDLGLNYHTSDMGIPISTARASLKFIHA